MCHLEVNFSRSLNLILRVRLNINEIHIKNVIFKIQYCSITECCVKICIAVTYQNLGVNNIESVMADDADADLN